MYIYIYVCVYIYIYICVCYLKLENLNFDEVATNVLHIYSLFVLMLNIIRMSWVLSMLPTIHFRLTSHCHLVISHNKCYIPALNNGICARYTRCPS